MLLPSRGHAGRYQPQLLLGFLLLVALAGARLWPRPWARPLLVLVLGGVLLSGYDALRYARAASAHIAHVHRRASIELADEVGEGARVAAFDIGVLAYDAPVALLDVSGLSSRETVEAIAAHRLPLWLARHNATHVLLPVTNDDGRNSLRARLGLAEADNFSLARVAGWESLDERWRPAFRYSGNAARGLWLYEIRRTPAAGFPE